MMTSKSDKRIQKADITRMAFNQGSLGMEFSWNYERQMHIAFAMMMNKILKKVYAEDVYKRQDYKLMYYTICPVAACLSIRRFDMWKYHSRHLLQYIKNNWQNC